MVKIGLTTKSPKERAAELSRATGVPLPFKLEWARAVSDCAYVEKVVHRMLDDRRVQGKVAAGARKEAEFFRVDVATARQVIEAGAGSMLGRPYRARPARPPMRRKGRRRRGKDLTGFGLAVSGLAFVALLVLLKPPLPGWLPGPVWDALASVERLGG